MSNLNPYDASFSTADVRRRTESDQGSLVFHLIGTFSLLWGIAAWLEWFLIPFFFPSSDGRVDGDFEAASKVWTKYGRSGEMAY